MTSRIPPMGARTEEEQVMEFSVKWLRLCELPFHMVTQVCYQNGMCCQKTELVCCSLLVQATLKRPLRACAFDHMWWVSLWKKYFLNGRHEGRRFCQFYECVCVFVCTGVSLPRVFVTRAAMPCYRHGDEVSGLRRRVRVLITSRLSPVAYEVPLAPLPASC